MGLSGEGSQVVLKGKIKALADLRQQDLCRMGENTSVAGAKRDPLLLYGKGMDCRHTKSLQV